MTGSDRRLDTQCAAPLSLRPHCPRPVASTPGVTISRMRGTGRRVGLVEDEHARVAPALGALRGAARAGRGRRGRGPPGRLRRLPGRGRPAGPGHRLARHRPGADPARPAPRQPCWPRPRGRTGGRGRLAAPPPPTSTTIDLARGLSAEQWRLPVIHGWDVDELLRHLAAAEPPAAGPDVALRQPFETWIHADDLPPRSGGRPPGPTTSTASWPWACGCCRRPCARSASSGPAGASSCAWRAGGGTWTVPPAGTGPPTAVTRDRVLLPDGQPPRPGRGRHPSPG